MKLSKLIKIEGQIQVIDDGDELTQMEFINSNKPFKIEKDVLNSVAVSKWSQEYLEQKIGRKEVSVYVSKRGYFIGGQGPYDPKETQQSHMTIIDFFKCVNKEIIREPLMDKNEKYYLYQLNIKELSELENDILEPTPIIKNLHRQGDDKQCNFWVSEKNNFTPPHTDCWRDNYFTQVAGQKKALLWSPEQAGNLYLYPFGHPYARQSAIDFNNIDLNKYPNFARAKALEATLNPGDMLYIPEGWIHAILSMNFSISLNFWIVHNKLYNCLKEVKNLMINYPLQVREQYLYLLHSPNSIIDMN